MQPCLPEKKTCKETCKQEPDTALIPCNDDLETSTFWFGDLYIIGKLWIDLLTKALVGGTIKLFPVVKAAPPPAPPKRPPKMKYKDLSLYETPHTDYKEYIADKQKCPDANVKLLHQFLLPHVKSCRSCVSNNLNETRKAVKSSYIYLQNEMGKSRDDFLKIMRDPNNLNVRRGVVAAGGITGCLIGGGGGIPRRLFCTSCGLLSAGAICFPNETDETFREISYHVGKTFLNFYNKWCRQQYFLRERVPCEKDMPPTPPYRKPITCPKN